MRQTEGSRRVHPVLVSGAGPLSSSYYKGGLTTREHFAAMAMQGMLANIGSRNGSEFGAPTR